MEQNLTEGSVLKTVIRFSLPFLLAYFLQTLYGMADLFIIGQFYGVESTTAVAIGSQVMHMLTVMIVGLAMGSVVIIGQAVGAGDKERMNRAIGNTVVLFLLLSLVSTVLLLMLVDPIVRAMSTPQEAAAGTRAYLTICFLGIPFITAYNMISSIFRGMGDSKTPMYLVAVACGANILLDYYFMGSLDLGPAGAALGTTISQTISVILSLFMIRRKKFGLHLSRSDCRPSLPLMGELLKIGGPVALQDGFIQIAFMVITIFANLRGLNDAAAVGIVEKFIGILFLLPSSMLQTVSTLSAQNMGAGKHDRARQTLYYACGISIAWGLLIVVLMHFYAPQCIGLFSNSAQAVASGCEYMKTYVWDVPFAGIHFCFSGFFCAYGLSGLSFLHNALSILLVRIPLSWFAAKYFLESLLPMGLGSPAGSLLSVIICVTAFLILRKKQRQAGIL